MTPFLPALVAFASFAGVDIVDGAGEVEGVVPAIVGGAGEVEGVVPADEDDDAAAAGEADEVDEALAFLGKALVFVAGTPSLKLASNRFCKSALLLTPCMTFPRRKAQKEPKTATVVFESPDNEGASYRRSSIALCGCLIARAPCAGAK